MNCDNCSIRKADPVPYIVHESAMARQERTIKRLWILLILVISLLVATNGAWLWWESQWEVYETYQEVTQEADGDGSNRFVGGDYYGWPESNNAD